MFYNKVGQEIDSETWTKLFQSDEYKIIRQEALPDGKWVSTIWIGIDFKDKNLEIFETIVFDSQENLNGIDMDRYSTEREALNGHIFMVKKYSK